MNTLEKVKDQMQKLTDAKAAELQAIQEKQEAQRAAITEAEKVMQQASEKLEDKLFAAAKAEKEKAETVLDMLNRREVQLVGKTFISEEESDKIIDSLLEYEGELETEFKRSAEVHLEALRELREEYLESVEDTERTITTWTQTIHKNYDTRGSVTRYDPVTGKMTTRSDTPVPVHPLGFHGCYAAELVGDFLQRYERQ